MGRGCAEGQLRTQEWKAPRGIDRAMLSGFNTNYRHRGVLFHVQTEDSGRSNPHVITHLFYGGNIIASEKRVYSDRLDGEDLQDEVRALMEGQHKEMLKRLSRGEHDATIAQRLGPNVLDGSADTSETLPPETEPAFTESHPGAAQAAGANDKADRTPDGTPDVTPDITPRDRIARAFGDGIVSEKPLDEVVLDYLVENARKRKRTAK
jgi:hypothetical protein